MRTFPGLTLVACTLLTLSAAAGEIYRTQDAEGNVIYTDTPPADSTEVEQVVLPPGPSEETRQNTVERQQKIQQEAHNADQRRQQQRQQQKERVAAAAAALAEAKAKLAKAKQITNEDRQNMAGGKRRIRPEYFERLKAAEEEVEKARKALREARGY